MPKAKISSKPTRLSHVEFQFAHAGWKRSFRAIEADCYALLQLACAAEKIKKTSLSVRFAADAEVQALNAQFRNKNKPTNVLSFPAGEAEYLGDVILAYETVRAESRAQKKTFRAHTLHLVLHGLLHLLGYDHEQPQEAETMEAREVALLARMAIANPYE